MACNIILKCNGITVIKVLIFNSGFIDIRYDNGMETKILEKPVFL